MTEKIDQPIQPKGLRIRDEETMKLRDRVKDANKLLEYKVALYSRELKKTKTALQHLEAGIEKRKKAHRCMFDNRRDIDQAYLAGKIGTKEYQHQLRAFYLTYTDNGYYDRIEWLECELEKYTKQLEIASGIKDVEEKQHAREVARKLHYNHMAKMRMRRYRKRLKEKKRQEAIKRYRDEADAVQKANREAEERARAERGEDE